jgi:D-3-phosphoglycerate dehydrogenase
VTAPFRVAFSGDFRRADGSFAYPMIDLSPLTDDPAIEVSFVPPVEGRMRAEDLAEHDALVLLAPRFDHASIPRNGRLGLVARLGVGYDTVEVPALTEAGIALVTTPDGVRRPVAVSVVTLLLALSQHLLIKDRLTRQGPEGWAERARFMGIGLVGRTFGQLGLGNIGAEVIRLLAPFGMRLIAHDPFVDATAATALGVTMVDEETLFRESDFLSICVPLSPATHHFVNARRLALMKPTSFLINTARGPVVDEAALIAALREGRIAGAGLDVFEMEPSPVDNPLFAMQNVIVAPHALCWTDQCFAGNGAVDVAACLAVMRGEVPKGLLNREVADHPAFRDRLSRNSARFSAIRRE